MSSLYKNIIFDLDGTLLDPKVGVIKSVKFTTQSLGLPDIPESIIVSFIGPPIRNSLQQYFNLDDLQADAAESIFRSRYKDVNLFFIGNP
jgi:phosphoglycolate phosphatase